jgi:two-component system NtrC family sensor kinase
MKTILSRLSNWRLQSILILSFALTAGITIVLGSAINDGLIRNYLGTAQDARVDRDMDLADAFYKSKLYDIVGNTGRMSVSATVRRNLLDAALGDAQAVDVLGERLESEIANMPPGSHQRFLIITDAQGTSIIGRVALDDHLSTIEPGTDWSSLPIVHSVLTTGERQAATEVVPAGLLDSLGLAEQARIPLKDTPKAAPEPFEPSEGTAGLVLVSVAPILSEQGQPIGMVLTGHLFNRDYTLVDRIKEVAGVDTVTIFFGDLRVSTNVEDEAGQRAIGTRVSQEVYDQVLLEGEVFTGPAYVVNQWYITRYEPLYNHRQQVVGMLYVGARQAAFLQLRDTFRRQVYLIAAATILLAVLIAIPLAWSASRPLSGLAEATRRVSEGDWSVRAEEKGYREMRTLAASFNTMVQALKDTQEQLVQKEKLASVGQLAAGVAHEINNPLGSVLLYADILRKETPDENMQQQEDLEMIIREATRCKTIVNDLLNFSRQNEVMAQETDLNQLLTEMAEEAGKQDLYQQIDIVTNLDPDLPHIQADPLQLRQVFINLMSNAAEAMPGGGTLTLGTGKGPSSGLVTVEVQDTGVGISEENMKKIFTPFFTTKPIGKGTGLGLAIIYGIVKMHRGQISLQSQPGKGTKFTIILREKLPLRDRPTEGSFVLQ